MQKQCIFEKVTLILVIIGALNWGLVGAFHFNLVTTIFGCNSATPCMLSRIVFILVGLSGLLLAVKKLKGSSEKGCCQQDQ